MQLILTGMTIGLIVAAPVGPVNILCIHRTLERGFFGGLAAGLGATLADGLIALLAALGLTAISGLMARYQVPIQLVGGLIMLAFGLKLFATRPRANGNGNGGERHGKGIGWTVPQTFVLTITNPGAVLGLFAIFSGAGSAIGLDNWREAAIVVLAVMAGSLVWWTGLSGIVARIRHKLTERTLTLINRSAGIALLLFGGLLILRAILMVT